MNTYESESELNTHDTATLLSVVKKEEKRKKKQITQKQEEEEEEELSNILNERLRRLGESRKKQEQAEFQKELERRELEDTKEGLSLQNISKDNLEKMIKKYPSIYSMVKQGPLLREEVPDRRIKTKTIPIGFINKKTGERREEFHTFQLPDFPDEKGGRKSKRNKKNNKKKTLRKKKHSKTNKKHKKAKKQTKKKN
jgi:hypothetical protein